MTLTLTQAHALVMILAWMTFSSTGILVARYGRSFRVGTQRQILGKAFWFQIHRLLLSLTPLLTFLGFYFIVVRSAGRWSNPQISLNGFIHSIFGIVTIFDSVIQIWLVLYRCNPHSRYRFMFDWIHRSFGFVAFISSIISIFIMIPQFRRNRIQLIIIMSLWTGLTMIVFIVCERIQCQQKQITNSTVNDVQMTQQNTNNNRPDVEAGTNIQVGNQRYNQMKFYLFLIHSICSPILSILLIIFICI